MEPRIALKHATVHYTELKHATVHYTELKHATVHYTELKHATVHYTEPVESTESRHIFIPLVDLVILFHLLLCF